ncbi:MAG: hypothetical protein JJU36_03725 [Phycisphaeraceae bacterium]|nr:hypothetical protein [Phycisphaeraceae bacterium]
MSAISGIGTVGHLPTHTPAVGTGGVGQGLVQGAHTTQQIADTVSFGSATGSAMHTSVVMRVSQAMQVNPESQLADTLRAAIVMWALSKLLGDDDDDGGKAAAAMAMLMIMAAMGHSETVSQYAVSAGHAPIAYNASGQAGSAMPQTGGMVNLVA